jgi:putative effector of murein hydrolase LrgA (UPF0299 family)
VQRWHIAMVFAGLSTSAVVFAWTTFNLYQIASSNFRFIANYGLMGLNDGGLLQFFEICFYALLSLLMFLLFKGCETEIMVRWRSLGKDDKAE